MSTWETVFAILGLTVITVATRGFFLYPERDLPLPEWLRQGLRYAPLAAIAAVVALVAFLCWPDDRFRRG